MRPGARSAGASWAKVAAALSAGRPGPSPQPAAIRRFAVRDPAVSARGCSCRFRRRAASARRYRRVCPSPWVGLRRRADNHAAPAVPGEHQRCIAYRAPHRPAAVERELRPAGPASRPRASLRRRPCRAGRAQRPSWPPARSRSATRSKYQPPQNEPWMRTKPAIVHLLWGWAKRISTWSRPLPDLQRP